MRINCPYCGLRSIEEFTYRGDATVTRPEGDADEEAFFRYVHIRRNPRGVHLEHWQHTGGCRAWLGVERNTATHVINGVWTAAPGPHARPEGTTLPSANREG